MRLVVFDFLETLQFFRESLHPFFGNYALRSERRHLIRGFRHHRCGRRKAGPGHAGQIELWPRGLHGGFERRGRVQRLTGQFFLQAVKQIEFQPSVRN